MKDGIYQVRFQGQAGAGMAMLVFDGGQIYGTDTEAGKYDGTYIFQPATGQVDAKVKVTFPPNVISVFGIQHPFEWAFEVETTFNGKAEKGVLALKNSLRGTHSSAVCLYADAPPGWLIYEPHQGRRRENVSAACSN